MARSFTVGVEFVLAFSLAEDSCMMASLSSGEDDPRFVFGSVTILWFSDTSG